MAHDRWMSLLRLEEGLGQRIPLPALDINKRHLWQLSPIEEDRVVKKQKEEDRVLKKQVDDDNDVNQEQRKSFRMKLPPLQFATWRTLTGKEWKDYNKCLEQSEVCTSIKTCIYKCQNIICLITFLHVFSQPLLEPGIVAWLCTGV